MADVKERLPAAAGKAGYEEDFHHWALAQAELVKQRRFSELDLPNLVEELESMGSEQRFALTSSYRVLLVHLLKWRFQPARRSRSWRGTIARERANIEQREAMNRTLAKKADVLVVDAFRTARRQAAAETGLQVGTFPDECPFTLAQLRDDEYMPD